jgi:cell division septation protein DedD
LEKEKPAAPSEPVRKADPAPTVKEASRPETSPEGAFVVQAASFRGPDDAVRLKERLSGKAYAAYTEQTDLKEKGVWHRVYIGPFATAEAAARVVEKLQAEEKLAALVKKR